MHHNLTNNYYHNIMVYKFINKTIERKNRTKDMEIYTSKIPKLYNQDVYIYKLRRNPKVFKEIYTPYLRQLIECCIEVWDSSYKKDLECFDKGMGNAKALNLNNFKSKPNKFKTENQSRIADWINS